VKATVNRCVFVTDTQFSRGYEFLISAGNLFHKVGAATLNAQSPYDVNRDTDTCNSILLDDLSFRDNVLLDTSSHRYFVFDNNMGYIYHSTASLFQEQ